MRNRTVSIAFMLSSLSCGLSENVDLTNRAMKEVSLQMENLQNVSDKEKKMTRSWCEDAKEAISKLKLTLQDRDAIIGDLKQELQEVKDEDSFCYLSYFSVISILVITNIHLVE